MAAGNPAVLTVNASSVPALDMKIKNNIQRKNLSVGKKKHTHGRELLWWGILGSKSDLGSRSRLDEVGCFFNSIKHT